MNSNDSSDSRARDVHDLARHGNHVALGNLLSGMSTNERNAALETRTKDDGIQFTTPLIIAASFGYLDCVQILLTYNANIEARGTIDEKHAFLDSWYRERRGPPAMRANFDIIEGCTALCVAAAYGHLEVVKMLVEANKYSAAYSGKTYQNTTTACSEGIANIASCLGGNGADVNAIDDSGSTPLMAACCNGLSTVVTYLIEHGANMDLQNIDGDTALHEAVYRKHLKIAKELSTRGAAQLPNKQCLTPILLASKFWSIDMVEIFIRSHQCSREQRIDALESLGASLAIAGKDYAVNNSWFAEKAFHYMKRGMEERFREPSLPLLKQEIEPLEVFQTWKECQTLEELALIEGKPAAICLEGLIIKDRILGAGNLERLRSNALHFLISHSYDTGNFDLSVSLRLHAMETDLRRNRSITSDLAVLVEVFVKIFNQNGCLPRQKCIAEVFEKTVRAYEREWHDLFPRRNEQEVESVFYSVCYLLMLRTKVQLQAKEISSRVAELTQRFLHLDPRTRDGNTLLHLLVSSKSPVEQHLRNMCKLPCVETMKFILNSEILVNAVNIKGDTPLHLAATFQPTNKREFQVLSDLLELLLDRGANQDLVNNKGKTALDIAETSVARRILQKSKLELKRIAAKAVNKYRLPYRGEVPKILEIFISMMS